MSQVLIKQLANMIFDIKDKISNQEFIDINAKLMEIFKDPKSIKKIYVSENDCCENCCGCCFEHREQEMESSDEE